MRVQIFLGADDNLETSTNEDDVEVNTLEGEVDVETELSKLDGLLEHPIKIPSCSNPNRVTY